MLTSAFLMVCCLTVAEVPPGYAPLERALTLQGTERQYFVVLPREFDPEKQYWPLVAVHGGGGKAAMNSQARALWTLAGEAELPAVLILPQFITEDKQLSRFPALGEEAFLKAVLAAARQEFNLRDKILLTGYSMGGQFTHRFALANPQLVQACAPFAAGTWTTPDGRLLVEEIGEVKHPREFLLDPANKRLVPERLHDLFDARTAAVAGMPAVEGATAVPFLVMCGTLDPRLSISVEFFASLREAGFMAEAAWPATPHSSDAAEFHGEFGKYPAQAVEFFKKHLPIN